MSKHTFQVRIDDWREVHALPDTWQPDALRAVLERAEYEDEVAQADLEDMAIMALQDLGIREASDAVLATVFGATMSDGVRQNLVTELTDDRPWEQFAKVDKQAGIFIAVTLLQKAFPTAFGTPDAVCIRLTVRGDDARAAAQLQGPPNTSLLVRLLAGGMAEDATLHRVYEQDLASEHFGDAEHILWRTRMVQHNDDGSVSFEVFSSYQWLGALEDADPWQCRAWSDALD